MRYVSTRGAAPVRDFVGVLLAGMAEDGGLYMPECWPELTPAEWRALRALDYPALAGRIIGLFAGPALSESILTRACREAYGRFAHPAVVPLVQLETGLFVQELFHGPTLAFKDLALGVMGRLFAHVLAKTGETIAVLGATSGDTGPAAIEACREQKRVTIVILHPLGRTSEVQRRQMTTVGAANVTNLAVQGSFDDCQDLVKACFADAPFRSEMRLAAVNSINWARVAAQVPYYVAAALALGAPEREVAFAVPTGNFGNVFAAWVARRMGLPVAALVVGSNRNDVLARFLAENDMSIRTVEPSLSPAMDIQVSSNVERLVFELLGREGKATAALMQRFRLGGRLKLPLAAYAALRSVFSGFSLDDEATLAEIHRLYGASGYLADPHSAIGIAAARANSPEVGIAMVAMATAHPAKFSEAMKAAVGFASPLPGRLADLYDRKEQYRVVPAEVAAIKAAIRGVVSASLPTGSGA